MDKQWGGGNAQGNPPGRNNQTITAGLNTDGPSLSQEQLTEIQNPWCDVPRWGGGEKGVALAKKIKMQGEED